MQTQLALIELAGRNPYHSVPPIWLESTHPQPLSCVDRDERIRWLHLAPAFAEKSN